MKKKKEKKTNKKNAVFQLTILKYYFLQGTHGNIFLAHNKRSFLEVFRLAIPTGSYMFKVNIRNTRTRCEICSKLTIKTPERRQ